MKLKFRAWDGKEFTYSDDFSESEFLGDNLSAFFGECYGCKFQQFIGIKDKNKKDVYVGDIVVGHVGWLSGDGRLRKGFPQKIRLLLQVVASDGKQFSAGFHLKNIKVHPDDVFAAKEYFYRSIRYHLEEDRECGLKNNKVVWKEFNESIEVIGNIEENKSLMKKSKVETRFW